MFNSKLGVYLVIVEGGSQASDEMDKVALIQDSYDDDVHIFDGLERNLKPPDRDVNRPT